MELISHNEILDKYIGQVGTEKRDLFEKELQNKVAKQIETQTELTKFLNQQIEEIDRTIVIRNAEEYLINISELLANSLKQKFNPFISPFLTGVFWVLDNYKVCKK